MRHIPSVFGTMALLGLLLTAAGCGRSPMMTPTQVPAPDVERSASKGSRKHKEKDKDHTREAVFAGGCFWCIEAAFQQIQGVKKVVSGYAGGRAKTAHYRIVATGRTEHAESVKVVYEPSVITYGQLLRVFFTAHDPTQLNRQGPDVGPQYRSAIFYKNQRQKRIAKAYIEQLTEAGVYEDPIVTELNPLPEFYPAEQYHQNYALKNPNAPYVQLHVIPTIKKVRRACPALTEGVHKNLPEFDASVLEKAEASAQRHGHE